MYLSLFDVIQILQRFASLHVNAPTPAIRHALQFASKLHCCTESWLHVKVDRSRQEGISLKGNLMTAHRSSRLHPS